VDGNGKADVIWRNSTDGVVGVWLMNRLSISSVGFPGSTSTDWEIQNLCQMNDCNISRFFLLNRRHMITVTG